MKDKILVLNIPCWNNQGSDTLTNLFSGYGADDIANIYFKAGTPTTDECNNFFYISENKVIKSIFNRRIQTGKMVIRGNESDSDIGADTVVEDKRFSFWSKHKWWSVFSLRELLWVFGKWRTKELDAFVDEFAPTKLFVPIEGYIYFNRVVVYLMRRLGIETYSFMWDDNFTYKQYPHNLFYKIHRFFLRRNVKQIINGSQKVFVISPKMKKELDSEYGIDSIILTKSATQHQVKNSFTRPFKLIYAGKLNLGRYDTVLRILKTINDFGTDFFHFDIFSQTSLSSKEIDSLNTCHSHFFGAVTKTTLDRIILEYDIIVVAEALEGKEKAVSRLSFSTKTTDSLALGKCVLCVCPRDNATYEYLNENNAAFCASNELEIKSFFQNVIMNDCIMSYYAINAADLICHNHDMKTIRKVLFDAMGIEEKL